MPPAKRTTSASSRTTSTSKSVESKAEDTKAPAKTSQTDPVKEQVDKPGEDKATETVKSAEERQEAVSEFVKSSKPTDEKYEDSGISISELPAHHDPVVNADHKQASHAMEADQGRIKAAARVQVRQFDNSNPSINVNDAMSSKNDEAAKKGSRKSK